MFISARSQLTIALARTESDELFARDYPNLPELMGEA